MYRKESRTRLHKIGSEEESQSKGRFKDHENETPEELSFKLDEATSVPTSDHSFPESHHTSIVDSEGDGDEETIENLSQALNASAQNHLSPYGPMPITPNRPCPRVRFRSRVRITAGMGPRRQLSEGLSSNASSISGSPSSSISAPLRTHATENAQGWGPLGRRVSLLASPAPDPPRSTGVGNGYGHDSRRSRSHSCSSFESAHERTRLVTSQNGYMYTTSRSDDESCDGDERERQWREQAIEEAFGKWPGRLLNRHWWCWQLEPMLCCSCICDDPDADAY